jgi:hypothetical protein
MDFVGSDIPKISYTAEPTSLILESSKKYISTTNKRCEVHETDQIFHT